MKQLVNGNDEPVSKAARVQPKHLPSSLHPQLTGTLRSAADDSHIVYAVAVHRHKSDAGRSLGYIVHGLSDRGLVLLWKRPIKLILNYPSGPQQVRVGKVCVGKGWISQIPQHDVAFKCFTDCWQLVFLFLL